MGDGLTMNRPMAGVRNLSLVSALSFFGTNDVEILRAQGVKISPEHTEKGRGCRSRTDRRARVMARGTRDRAHSEMLKP